VVTGAAGRIGRSIVPPLSARWDVVATDLTPDSCSGITSLDVTDEPACREAFRGADAILHLAAIPDPYAGWDRLLPANVIGTHAVARAAADAGAHRLVLASSLQAVRAMPCGIQRRADDPARPANLYGATKAWAEALGSWIATTSSTTVVALRIGYFAPGPPDHENWPTDDLAAWLSPRDATELARAAVEAEDLTFAVVNGTSANRFPQADLSQTRRLLGYQPLDDAWAGRG
jgi:uronate dehydrogenase